MAFAQVQTITQATGTGATVACTVSATGAKNLIVGHIAIAGVTETCTGVTDDKGNTYVVQTAVDNGDNSFRTYQFYGVQITGGTTTITPAFSGAVAGKRVGIDEYSGGAETNATAFDTTQTGTGNSANLSVSTLTPSNTGNLIVATLLIDNNYNWTAGSGYTLYSGTNPIYIRSQYKLSSGASETAPATTTSGQWAERATSFKPLGGATVTLPYRSLLGVGI